MQLRSISESSSDGGTSDRIFPYAKELLPSVLPSEIFLKRPVPSLYRRSVLNRPHTEYQSVTAHTEHRFEHQANTRSSSGKRPLPDCKCPFSHPVFHCFSCRTFCPSHIGIVPEMHTVCSVPELPALPIRPVRY